MYHGNIENKYSVGTNNLIKRGAKVLTTIEDVIEEYPIIGLGKNNSKIPKEKEIPTEYKNVYNEITDIAISVDELQQNTNMSINELNAQLTILELEDLIIKLPGGLYIRNEG